MFDHDSGILLHPTSLPGAFGIGDLGPSAHSWLEFIAAAACGHWQVLPLGPTGYGDSPYQSFSAFAGNPYLVSPELLAADGLLDDGDLAGVPAFPAGRVDYGPVIEWKLQILNRAVARYRTRGVLGEEFADFRNRHRQWLRPFAEFMAIKTDHGGGIWTEWPPDLVRGERTAVDRAVERLAADVEAHEFRQFLFDRQWGALKGRAAELGIRVIGDAPIFVAADSADVWSNPGLFQLDADRRPTVVAGVPPDYFSATGQLWGNPLYDWEAHANSGYAWWIDRLRTTLHLVDVLRIDHFRGFVDYWEIPGGAPNAIEGRWVDGPGEPLFVAVRAGLGDLPIIAEDLGELHDTVPRLRDRLDLPGMKVYQFAFDGDPENEFLPHRHPVNCVAYTGTHDNDTTLGWFTAADDRERDRALAYLDSDGEDIVGDMLDSLWSSAAALTVAPLQDFLRLGTEARMNTPGVAAGNWEWRMDADALDEKLARSIWDLNQRAGRSRG
jgi:4-alpha-glucanotransferase